MWAAHGLLGSNTCLHSVEKYSTFLVLLHLCLLPMIWVSDGVGGHWVSRVRSWPHASLTRVFTGPRALHVFAKQRLPEDHLPQLAARLQRGADHVLLAGGTECCGVGETGSLGSHGMAIFIY